MDTRAAALRALQPGQNYSVSTPFDSAAELPLLRKKMKQTLSKAAARAANETGHTYTMETGVIITPANRSYLVTILQNVG